MKLRAPYLIYFGDVADAAHAKTGLGLIQWRREQCAGQMRAPGCRVDGGIREMCIDDAAEAGVKSLLIGVAPSGGSISAAWIADLAAAARAGLDIVSGMHARLSSFPEIAAAARQSGVRLIDVRTPPKNIPVGTGEKRSGKRLLTVGSDCAVGKKYTALSIEKEMRARGWAADFRATGQTGIMIAGSGIAIDSVVADFLSGAAEMLSPSAPANHWDVIEGQGSLFHPSFAGVSLGLLHGSQPDALVLCHDPTREFLLGMESPQRFSLVPPRENIELCLALARRVNKNARFVGVSLNTSSLSESERAKLYDQYAEETGLPVADPIRDGVGPFIDRLETEQGE
ncbi:DUF1611 domain-containing protein [Marinicaulis flavus]|uniref:DUF1611 domain-containing protein n=1 Tax=Hyphococcus luteus TaxID=2058213 RepID=A0A2S7K249_9PROT|nr:DUF1611 domain-containing protein [Marinicaulis flavus]